MIRYDIPYLKSPYTTVYRPGGDVYLGPDTLSFKNSQYYEDWIVNDFTVIKGVDGYHLIGITHPKPKGYVDPYHHNPDTLHEAEWQLFHAFSPCLQAEELLRENSFTDKEKILYPQQRPGERNEIWAPHCIKKGDLYYLIYSPGEIRLALSADLYHFTPKGTLLTLEPFDRDPNVCFDGQQYILTYVAGNTLQYRTSPDLLSWSDPSLLQTNPFRNGMSESPFLIRRKGIYYLFWAICDGLNGSYDNRTFVFASESLDDFEGRSPLTILPAHAPEILQEEERYYLASVFYPANGVSIAPLGWK